MRAMLALATLLVAAPPNVDKILLAPEAQVGKGYVLVQRSDSFGVKGTVTLDICGRSGYFSEALRAARIQVNYIKQGVDYVKHPGTLGLSNEVVRYQPGGAKEAMQEVLRHAVTCPHRPIDTGEAGLPKLLLAISRIHDIKLLPGYVALKIRTTGNVRGTRVDQTSYAIYQRVGNFLSGVYSFGANSPAQERFVLHAAEESAGNLQRVVKK